MLSNNTHSIGADVVQNKPTVLRKVIRYLQHQALDQTSTKQYLTPGKEPQHRGQKRHTVDSHQPTRNFSTDSTVVNGFYHTSSEPNDLRSQSRMAVLPSTFAQNIKRVQYAQENLLQSYEVFVPEPSSQRANDDKYWIVYIHGGYFRDPKVDATSFRPALNFLAESAPSIAEETEAESLEHPTEDSNSDFFAIQHNIAGFASINYRLAPHVGYPQDPETTPRYELRNAQWPDQINDILAALRHLQSKHDFGSKYVIAGHSVGAQLAFLAALNVHDAGLPSPKCVIGCNGIYDFPAIHKTYPKYETMTRNAMESEYYIEASPALCTIDDYTKLADQGTTRFILSHSRDDELVNWEQVEIMKQLLDQVNAAADDEIKVKLVETNGSHNALWTEGKPLALVIKDGLNLIFT